jgi:hypothetical protein
MPDLDPINTTSNSSTKIGVTSYLDALGAYTTWYGNDELLDFARLVVESQSYFYTGLVFPNGADVNIPARTTFAGNVSIEPLTYVLSIGGWSNQPEGFKVRVYDKGSKADIIERQFTFYSNVASEGEGIFGAVPTPLDVPFGPYFLTSPFIIMPPGSVQIEVTNQSPAAAIIQVMLGCCIPVTDRSINQVTVARNG